MSLIPNNIFDDYYKVVDELLANEYTSTSVVYYFQKKLACPNCLEGATNVYRPGGPIPFSVGVCPYCGGKNHVYEQTTSSGRRLRVYYNKKEWIQLGSIEFVDGMVQIRGYSSDIPTIKQCDKMKFFKDHDVFYKLNSTPFPYGFGERYFIAYCVKV